MAASMTSPRNHMDEKMKSHVATLYHVGTSATELFGLGFGTGLGIGFGSGFIAGRAVEEDQKTRIKAEARVLEVVLRRVYGAAGSHSKATILLQKELEWKHLSGYARACLLLHLAIHQLFEGPTEVGAETLRKINDEDAHFTFLKNRLLLLSTENPEEFFDGQRFAADRTALRLHDPWQLVAHYVLWSYLFPKYAGRLLGEIPPLHAKTEAEFELLQALKEQRIFHHINFTKDLHEAERLLDQLSFQAPNAFSVQMLEMQLAFQRSRATVDVKEWTRLKTRAHKQTLASAFADMHLGLYSDDRQALHRSHDVFKHVRNSDVRSRALREFASACLLVFRSRLQTDDLFTAVEVLCNEIQWLEWQRDATYNCVAAYLLDEVLGIWTHRLFSQGASCEADCAAIWAAIPHDLRPRVERMVPPERHLGSWQVGFAEPEVNPTDLPADYSWEEPVFRSSEDEDK